MRVLVVADTDSYVKWGAAVAKRMPPGWRTSVVVLETPLAPSVEQLSSALVGSGYLSADVPVLSLRAVAARVRTDRHDVVLLATRGLVIRVLIREITEAASHRPIFVSGLPGVSIPATRKALYYRAQCDLFLLHSTREVREFRRLAVSLGITQDFALASLPFLPGRRAADRPDGDIVFAAQSKVPPSREDRMRVVGWLIDTARRHPTRTVVVKLRGRVGEQQTHADPYPYDHLLDSVDDVPPNLAVSYRSMTAHLADASGLVTVSSTAAIEAVATGVPVIALDDFGVDDDLINTVFVSSGLLAGSSALIAGEFRDPDPAWRRDNYFHGSQAEDWADRVETLVLLRSIDAVPPRPAPVRRLDGALRRAWDRKLAVGRFDRSASGALAAVVGVPARWALIAVRRLRRSIGGQVPAADRLAGPVGDLVDQPGG